PFVVMRRRRQGDEATEAHNLVGRIARLEIRPHLTGETDPRAMIYEHLLEPCLSRQDHPSSNQYGVERGLGPVSGTVEMPLERERSFGRCGRRVRHNGKREWKPVPMAGNRH